MDFIKQYISTSKDILDEIDSNEISKIIDILQSTRDSGRLFILGVGGGAGHASHAVNDFRKICNIEAYCPSDNVSELTARTNDDGFDYIFQDWFKTSKVNKKDLPIG